MRPISVPFPFFTDNDGNPLDGGSVYFGTENQNPETSPLTVYADADGVTTVNQPVRTSAGRMVRNGNAINVFVEGRYSMTVRDSQGNLVMSQLSNADQVAQTGTSNAVDDLGILNDGTGDQGVALNLAFSSNSYLFLPAGTYNIDTMLTVDCSNLLVEGVPGGTVITSSTLTELVQLINLDNVHFYGIRFETTASSATAADGVVIGPDAVILDSSFERCELSAPDCKSGGIYISGTGDINNLAIESNTIDDVGGKGIFIEATSYTGCKIKENSIKTTGQYSGESGAGITLGSGGDGNTVSGNAFDDVLTSCIHLSGCSNSVIANNVFDNLSRACSPITSDAVGGVNDDNKFSGNVCTARVFDGGVTLVNMNRPVFSGNTWKLTDKFSLDDVVQLKSCDDYIDTQDVNAVYITGTSTGNEWKGGVITNATAATSASNDTVLTDGAGVTDNRFVSVEVYKEAAGQLSGTANGSEAVLFVNCSGDSTQGTDGVIESWTPVVSFSDMTGVAYTAVGLMIKNGAFVSGSGRLNFTNKGSGGAGEVMTITGLNYGQTAEGPTAYIGGGTVFRYTDLSGLTNGATVHIDGDGVSTVLRIMVNGGSNSSAITRGDMQNTSIINFTFQYMTDE